MTCSRSHSWSAAGSRARTCHPSNHKPRDWSEKVATEAKSHNRKHGNSQYVHLGCVCVCLKYTLGKHGRSKNAWVIGAPVPLDLATSLLLLTKKVKWTISQHVRSILLPSNLETRTTPWYEGRRGFMSEGRRKFKEITLLRLKKVIRRTIYCVDIFAGPCSIPASRFKTILTFWYMLLTHLCMPELPVIWIISSIPQTLPVGLHCLVPFYITEVTQIT